MVLSDEQVRSFHEDGFVIVPDVFGPDEIDEVRAAFAGLERAASRLGETGVHRGSVFVLGERPTDGRSAGVRIDRVVWCGAAEPVLDRYGRDRRLLEIAALLLGSNTMNQLINQAHFKLPGDGVDFPWHQDSSHRRYGGGEWSDANGRGSYVQTVTAIDDATEHNGPLRFIPGSCALGHVDVSGSPGGRFPPSLVDASRAVTATMRAGSVAVFGPYTVHGSGANRSRRPRRAFINGFAYPGANTRRYPGEGAGRLLRI